ncbi:hypothetical protein MHM98_14430 [Psychrobium sp. MM17-31]|uniref:hypothetical protein n=1 Tax=Psychrobium sp. MM17-31 TaxID=2917758 RepID=UPI001EF563D6|nr:hypothetical protein [Psychrobium sp. MM17-31]MCG7532532.1 hypothetical protein [Psychrobium sp. MM17-31]
MKTIQRHLANIGLLMIITLPAYGQGDDIKNYLAQNPRAKDSLAVCHKISNVEQGSVLTLAQQQNVLTCLKKKVETITVVGRQWLPQEVEVTGQYTLSRDFLDRSAIGNGNITDMLTILPGIQGSEDSEGVEQQAELKSKLISISGGRPSDTGFFIDGMSNNSAINPDATSLSVNSIDEIQGHPQQTFVNQAVVGQVKVFDSNIPVEYGGFSGGVVDVVLRDERESPSFRFDYRTSRSEFNEYRLIDNIVRQQAEEEQIIDIPIEPDFKKTNLNMVASQVLDEHHSISMALSRTESKITTVSLLKPVVTSRESANYSLGYSMRNLWLDKLSLRINHSPYQGNHIRKDVLNSDFSIKGGGTFASLRANHSWSLFDWNASLRYGESDNSRRAPQYYLPWFRAKGKEWGIDSIARPLSKEGGYGDLDKEQKTLSLTQKFLLNDIEWLGLIHELSFGLNYDRRELTRQRPNAAIDYSMPLEDGSIKCGDATLDCIEQTYQVPLDELAQQLGGVLDLRNPEHFKRYQDNIITRGQFFRSRRVYPLEDINVTTNNFNAWLQDRVELGALRLTLGLKLDRNQFLKQWNIAPRLHGGLDLFGDEESLLVFGVSRYYANDMMSYKLKEAKRGYVTQYRPVYNGIVQPWTNSLQELPYRYLYENLSTPFSDELTLGLKQKLFGGVLSLTAVHRDSKDKVVRGDSYVRDGYTYIVQSNNGEATHKRLSLSYSIAFENHQLMFNTSKTENTSNGESSELPAEVIPSDERVYIYTPPNTYKLVSQSSLTQLQDNFSRPITANLSLSSQWTKNLRSSLSVSYRGRYESMEYTGLDYTANLGSITEPGEEAYPVFQQTRKPATTRVNGKVSYDYDISAKQSLRLSLEVANLLNKRTYQVGLNQIGLETGRSFWLGLSYNYD